MDQGDLHSIKFRVKLNDDVVREAVYQNLCIESDASRTERADFSVQVDGDMVDIEITARDLVMLRAFSNSVFRILKTSVEVADVLL